MNMNELNSFEVAGIGIFALVWIVVQVLYLLSLYNTMKAAPEKHHMFPAWFVWMMIIPVVGFIFAWIMVPFGVPKTMEAASGTNQEMKNASKTLFGLGLAQMILFTLIFIPIVNFFTGIAGFVLWIIYWVKIVSFKNDYLTKPVVIEHDIENNK